MRRLVLTVAVVLGLVSPMSPTTQAHADFDLRVIWPTVKLIDPSRTSYAVTVSDSGPGALEARWLGSSVPIPHHGTLELPLTQVGDGRVEIWRCTTTCEWAGVSSPVLGVRTSLPVYAEPLMVGAATEIDASVLVAELFAAGTLDLTWRITAGTDGTGETLATGHPTVAFGHRPTFSVTPPPTLVAGGDYSWVVTVTAPFGDGTLTGSSAAQPVLVDKTAPAVVATATVDHIEPAADNYLDQVVVDVPANEQLRVRLDVVGPQGSTVVTGQTWNLGPGGTAHLAWDGRLPSGKIAPPGDYVLDLRVTDLFDNLQTTTFPVAVGDGKLEYLTWQSPALKPANSIKARAAGACASLKIPSATQGAGSVGYVADARCFRPGTDDNLVWTQYVAQLPASFKNRYRGATIDSLASGRSGVRSSLMVGPIRDDGTWEPSERRIGPVVEWRELGVPAIPAIAHTAAGGLLTWRAGTDHRSRVDVKRFRISLDYQVLLHPDGSWEIPVG